MNKKITLEDLDQSGTVMFIGGRIVGKQMFLRIVAEMRQYKTIEKELGIDLETLFKALKDGIYFKVKDKIYFTNGLNLDFKEKALFEFNEYGDYEIYELDEYGKTWALTKKELK